MTILALVEEAVQTVRGVPPPPRRPDSTRGRSKRWRAGAIDDERRGPRTVPRNKLSTRERERVVGIATSPEFLDLSLKQISAVFYR